MQEEFWSAEQLLNRIYQMDCLELLKKMPDETVSLILTDPPYGISYQNQYTCRKHRLLQGDNGIPYESFAKEAFRVLKNNSHAYFFTRYDCYPHHYRCLEQAGFRIKNCLVVEKGTVGGGLVICMGVMQTIRNGSYSARRGSGNFSRQPCF